MRTRRNAIVLAVSLMAHLALLAAWMSTRPDLAPAESPILQVELLRPTPHVPPRPGPIPPPRVASATSESPPAAPPASAPPAPPPAEPASKVIDPRLLTDEELLARSGPRPDLRKLQAEEARRPVFSRRRGLGPDEAWTGRCKPSWENSSRVAPSCPSDSPEERAAKSDPAKDSKTAGFEEAGRYKRAMKTYKELPGAAGYPGFACALFHKC